MTAVLRAPPLDQPPWRAQSRRSGWVAYGCPTRHRQQTRPSTRLHAASPQRAQAARVLKPLYLSVVPHLPAAYSLGVTRWRPSRPAWLASATVCRRNCHCQANNGSYLSGNGISLTCARAPAPMVSYVRLPRHHPPTAPFTPLLACVNCASSPRPRAGSVAQPRFWSRRRYALP